MELFMLLALLAICGLGWEVQRIADTLTASRQRQDTQEPYDTLLDTIERSNWHQRPPPPRR